MNKKEKDSEIEEEDLAHKEKEMKLTKDYYRKLNEKDLTVKEVKNGKLSTFSYVHGGVDFTDKKIRLAR